MHVAEVAPCFERFGLQIAEWGLSGPNLKSRKFTPQMHLFLMKKQQKNKVNEVSLFMERDFCHCLLAGPRVRTNTRPFGERRGPQCAAVPRPAPGPCSVCPHSVMESLHRLHPELLPFEDLSGSELLLL